MRICRWTELQEERENARFITLDFEGGAMGHTQTDDRRIPKPIGGPLPEPPVFTTFEEERRYRKLKLAAAFRIFARFGMAEGIAGHITVRDRNSMIGSG